MKTKVIIAEPDWKFVYAESHANFGALLLATASKGLLYGVQHACNLYVSDGREEMTKEFLQTDATHMFCLDSDMGIPLNAIERLASHHLPIVGGLYVSRHNNNWPFIWEEMISPNGRFLDWKVAADWPPGALVECDVTGAGCLLIERSVFEAIGQPWWRTDKPRDVLQMVRLALEEQSQDVDDMNGRQLMTRLTEAVDKMLIGPGGIDIAFLRRARRAGYQVYVDTSIECAHYHVGKLTIQNFYNWRDNKRDNKKYPIEEPEV